MKHSRVRGRRRSVRKPEVAGVILRSGVFLILLAGCVLGVQWLREGVHRSIRFDNAAEGPSLTVLAGLPQQQIQARNRRIVYPYSVVPGGVRSADELREVASHDPVVAQHYAGFNFRRARVIEVQQPQLVYVSYRRGERVYWTHKQASLHKGEKLITDGQTTARTRCGNQVSVLPRAEISAEEPTMAELERPDAMASGIEQPQALNSNLLSVDPGMPLGPGGPGSGTSAGGVGTFVPPPIGGGGIGTPIGGNCRKNCSNNPPPPPTPPPTPPPPPPPTVPEPSTVVLMVSGAAAVFARLHSKRS